MKITDVRTVLLTGPCTNDPFLSECRRHRSAAFIPGSGEFNDVPGKVLSEWEEKVDAGILRRTEEQTTCPT